jgi:hypothetical protein
VQAELRTIQLLCFTAEFVAEFNFGTLALFTACNFTALATNEQPTIAKALQDHRYRNFLIA